MANKWTGKPKPSLTDAKYKNLYLGGGSNYSADLAAWNAGNPQTTQQSNVTPNKIRSSNNTNVSETLAQQNTTANTARRNVAEDYFRSAGFSQDQINQLMNYYNQNLNQSYETNLDIIRTSDVWKQRFAGNQQRIASGLNPLDTASYLAMENQYKQLLKQNADIVPSDFTRYVTGWIGGDVSVTELKGRLDQAREWAKAADPYTKQVLKDFYNVDESGIAMYALAPDVTEAELTRRGNVISVAAEARGKNLDISRKLSDELVSKGYEDATQVRQAFSDVAANKETVNKLASIEQQGNITEEEMIKSQLDLDTTAKSKLRGLRTREESRFGGSGAGTNILGSNVSGSY